MITVLDTNILVSALLTPHGTAARIVDAALDRRLHVAITPHLQHELERALRYPHVRTLLLRQWTPDQLDAAIMNFLDVVLHVPNVEPTQHWVADADDDWLLQCAITVQANVILSGDKAVLAVGAVEGIPIMAPAVFLQTTLFSG